MPRFATRNGTPPRSGPGIRRAPAAGPGCLSPGWPHCWSPSWWPGCSRCGSSGSGEAADLAAAVAEASRVDDASRAAPNLDQALLLALEADRVHDSPDTRAVVANLMSDHAELIRSLPTAAPVQGLAVSPDGTTLLVGEGDSGTTAYRTETLDKVSTFAVNGWTITYRADGQQLLLAGKGRRWFGGGLGCAVSSGDGPAYVCPATPADQRIQGSGYMRTTPPTAAPATSLPSMRRAMTQGSRPSTPVSLSGSSERWTGRSGPCNRCHRSLLP